MRFLLDFIKGIAIGIANVIPGFSGGTMAIVMHVYDRLIGGLSDFFSHPIKVIKDLWALAIGLVVGIVIAVFGITLLLQKLPLPTMMLFVGLIIGTIPNIFKETKGVNKINALWMIPAIVLIVALPFISTGDVSSNLSFWKILVISLIGVVAALTMIIPGVSGSLTLMALGFYTLIMTSVKEVMEGFLHFNFKGMGDSFFITLSFGIGVVLGIVFTSKLIKYLLSKYKGAIYFIILGLLIASPFSMIYTLVTDKEYDINYGSPLTWILSVILLGVGVALPILVERIGNKYNKEKLSNSSMDN